jgi:predicted permease
MDNFMIALSAVMPFVVYILMGIICKRIGLVKEDFLKQLNTTVFKCFFPFIMFNNLYDVDFSTLRGSYYVVFAFVATVVLIIVSCLVIPIFVKENKRRGVMIQASFRSKAVLYAIPLVESVYGPVGAVKACILIAFIVPLYNIVSVVVLECYRGKSVTVKKLLLNVLKNPLIIGAIAGVIFNLLPVTMPECLASPVSVLAGIATPMSLFVLGGTLHISDMGRNKVPLVITTVQKLIVVPAIVVCLMRLGVFDFAAEESFAVFCSFATPVAAASFPMAQSMGGDAALAGEYVVVTTLCSIFTIFVWILVLV